jgi:diguanylate cyclase (GGDEF)-like protein/PAS domain S-box-containing protein
MGGPSTSVRRSLLRSRQGGDSPAGVLIAAALMFAATAAWRFSNDDALNAIGILYVVPVVLLSVRFGRRAGIAGATVAVALTVLWTQSHAPGHLGPTGYLVRVILLLAIATIFAREVARRQRVERQAEQWFSMSDELCSVANFAGSVTRVNESWTRHLGYTEAELLDTRFLDLCHPDDVERARTELAALSGDASMTAGFEARWLAKGGTWHWLLWSARSDDASIYAAGRDITERKQLEQTLHTLATEDSLTGLPNRRAWNERFHEELARTKRSGNALSVAMLDLDGLKERNDAQGHAAGDRLLKQVAGMWQTALRGIDYLGRVGGDEFAVILPGCDIGDRASVIERLTSAMPPGQSVSVGVATWDGEESAQELLKRADDLLYEAKAARSAQTP